MGRTETIEVDGHAMRVYVDAKAIAFMHRHLEQ